MKEPDFIEKASDSPLTTGLAAITAAALAPTPFGLLASLVPAFSGVPAARRFKRRIEEALADLNEFLQEQKAQLQILTDAQYEFVAATLQTLLETTDQEKIELLKNAIRNGIQEPFEMSEAKMASRILRDLSYEEAKFAIAHISEGRFSIWDPPDAQGEFSVKPDTKERLLVAGLVSVGVLMQSDTIGASVNSYEWSQIASKVTKLLAD
jgi:anti-sigma28 factor (negative regulator of flagellin synthesis)